MERLSETVLRYAQGQPEGTPVLAKTRDECARRASAGRRAEESALAARLMIA